MARPTNILLAAYLRAAAKRLAAERGLSVSAYIRELIRADDIREQASGCDISSLIGILGTEAGTTDISRHRHIMVRQASSARFTGQQQVRASPE